MVTFAAEEWSQSNLDDGLSPGSLLYFIWYTTTWVDATIQVTEYVDPTQLILFV